MQQPDLSTPQTASVQIFLRLKPCPTPYPHLTISTDPAHPSSPPSLLTLHLPPSLSTQPLSTHVDQYSFPFSAIFPPSSPPATVHTQLSLPLLSSFTSGLNASLLTLGPLNSGKSYSLTGGRDYPDRGLVPRALEWLQEERERQRADYDWDLSLSHIEVYHETLTDLLSPPLPRTPHHPDPPSLSLREDEAGVVSVKGLTRVAVTSTKAAMQLYLQSLTRRHTAAHPLNPASSRSHSLLTLHLTRRQLHSSQECVQHSKLHLCDLAGVERLGRNPLSSASSPALLREAKSINRQLSYLEQVVVALTEKAGGRGGGRGKGEREFVPWRQSKLTLLLKDCIVGGHCAVLACADPAPAALEDTLHLCRLSARMRGVESKLTVNVELDMALMAERRGRELAELREELRMYDEVRGRPVDGYLPLTPQEVAGVREEVGRYVRGEVAEMEVDSMRKVREVFRQMKALITAPPSVPSLPTLPTPTPTPAPSVAAAAGAATQRPAVVAPTATAAAVLSPEAAETAVAGTGATTARSVGLSRDGRRGVSQGKDVPSTPLPMPPAKPPTEKEEAAARLLAEAEAEAQRKVTVITPVQPLPPTAADTPAIAPATVEAPLPLGADGALPGEAVAFVHWKAGAGTDLWARYAGVGRLYGEVRRRWEALVGRMSVERDWLVAHKRQWGTKGPEGEEVLTAEEWDEWQVWRERKRTYRAWEAERRGVEGEVEEARRAVELAQGEVVAAFNGWYREQAERVGGKGLGGEGAKGGRREKKSGWWEEAGAGEGEVAEGSPKPSTSVESVKGAEEEKEAIVMPEPAASKAGQGPVTSRAKVQSRS